MNVLFVLYIDVTYNYSYIEFV